MKKYTWLVVLTVLATIVLSGCAFYVRPIGPPVVAIDVGPPAPLVVSVVPDAYIWDGYEYVGWSGDRYVYWNGGVWIGCNDVVTGRFHGWTGRNPYYRSHAAPYHRGYVPNYRGGRGGPPRHR